MIVHSYLTNGKPMFGFAELFLDSFKYYNGEKTKIVFSTRDFKKNQILNLKKRYKNLDIWNTSLNYKYLYDKLGFDENKVKRLKNVVEAGRNITFKTDLIRIKQFISVEDRYRNSIPDVMTKYNDYEHILHLDIDMCFCRKITKLSDIIKENDISLRFRPKRSAIKRLIVGGLIGININENGWKFINTWSDYIDKISLVNKPKGYGQLSLYHTFNDQKDNIKIGKFPNWVMRNNKNFDKNKMPIVISGNKGSKLNISKELSKIYKG